MSPKADTMEPVTKFWRMHERSRDQQYDARGDRESAEGYEPPLQVVAFHLAFIISLTTANPNYRLDT